MASRRVVITGVGVVSALGNNSQAFWSALVEGRSGIQRIETVDPSGLHFTNGAEIRNFAPSRVLPQRLADQTDRFTQFALVAADEATTDAGLTPAAFAARRSGAVTGSSIGGQTTQDAGFATLYLEGRTRVPPSTIPRVMPNAAVSHITIMFGITGPSYAVSTACSSSNFAIGQAFWLVRSGVIDVALTGGSEAPFSFGNLKAWDALRVISPDTCRPFSANRRGMILGEGGGMLVLEDAELAEARGARIYCEIVGFGMSADAHHLVQPWAEGAASAMRAALDDACLLPDEVDYVNAHGSGTIANDASEARAIRTVFGNRVNKLAVSSTKSMHGHALGAAGALEAIATVLAIDRQLAPPTANHLGSDPDCDLDVLPNIARPCEINVALSNAFAFGGLNAVLAFRRWLR
jgi:nodulation protein E